MGKKAVGISNLHPTKDRERAKKCVRSTQKTIYKGDLHSEGIDKLHGYLNRVI